MLKDSDPALLAASVRECTLQLRSHLFRPLWKFFQHVYNRTRDRNDAKDILSHFTTQMMQVPDWSQRRLQKITDELLQAVVSKGFNLQKCVHGIVVDRTMLMTARYNGRVKVVVPDKYAFLHSLLCVLATDLAEYPEWITTAKNPMERQQQRMMAVEWFRTGIDDVLANYVGTHSAFSSMCEQPAEEEAEEVGDEEEFIEVDDVDDDDDDDDVITDAAAAAVASL